jgi:hypothetical protein
MGANRCTGFYRVIEAAYASGVRAGSQETLGTDRVGAGPWGIMSRRRAQVRCCY